MDLQEGLVVAERFRLVRQLGQGGMGAVWEAVHLSLDTPCAVKFIHEEAATSVELRTRFEREAKAAAQLRSPNVVQVLDHGVWQGRPYIAMELLEGEDLARRLRRRRPLPATEVVAIAAHVARALTKAHAAGLIHRDLKPANIFLVKDDDHEIAKVLDFGVAKSTTVQTHMSSEAETRTGAILGTPFYMSPEQARGNKDIDHRADLWALSVVIYQRMTGKLPFRSDALGDLLVKIIVEPLPVPSEITSVPVGFDAWWKRAADRDISSRFQTAKDLADALGLALDITVAWSPTARGGARATLDTRRDEPLTPAPSSSDAPALAEALSPGGTSGQRDDAVEPRLAGALPPVGTPLSGVSQPELTDGEPLPALPRRSLAPVAIAIGAALAVASSVALFVGGGAKAPATVAAPSTPPATPSEPATAAPPPETPRVEPSSAASVDPAASATAGSATATPTSRASASHTPATKAPPSPRSVASPGPRAKTKTDFGI